MHHLMTWPAPVALWIREPCRLEPAPEELRSNSR